MRENEKDPRITSLEDRLNQARKKEAQAEWQEDPPNSAWGIASKMGVELVAGSGVGAFIGFWFDKWFGTMPLFLVLLLVLGFASGLRSVIREARRSQEAEEETKN